MEAPRARTVTIAVLGLIVVTGYAALISLDLLVLDPMAAVPDLTLPEIYAQASAAGMSMDGALVIGASLVGPLAALLVLIGARQGKVTAARVAALLSGILILGAPAHFFLGFGPGITVADTFFVGGGRHTPWWMVLTLVSALAVASCVVASRRATRQVGLAYPSTVSS